MTNNTLFILIGILCLLVGFAIGVIFKNHRKPEYDGQFKFNLTDPFEETVALDLWRMPQELMDKKELIFQVVIFDKPVIPPDDSKDLQGLK